MRPKVVMAVSTMRSTSAFFEMSAVTQRAWRPSDSICAASVSRLGRWSALATMSAPSRANVNAISRPMPRAAPVTSATLPSSLPMVVPHPSLRRRKREKSGRRFSWKAAMPSLCSVCAKSSGTSQRRSRSVWPSRSSNSWMKLAL